jgi:predicted nucleic acid-binding protein
MAVAAVIDTNVILNAKNSKEALSTYSVQVIDAIEEGAIRGIISTISIAELCAGYYSQGDIKGKDELIAHLVSSKHFLTVGFDLKLADEAAKVRAETGLRLPDSIIVATGLVNDAKYIITNDKELKKAKSHLDVVSPKEMLDKLRREARKK